MTLVVLEDQLRFEVAGVPNTRHRARSFIREDGRIGHRKDRAFAEWKRSAGLQALAARPRGWRLDRRYAVEVIGYVPREIIDADNLRGILDACQGILWTNDQQVRPVVYDYALDDIRPRLAVHVVAFDPRVEHAEIEITIRRRSA